MKVSPLITFNEIKPDSFPPFKGRFKDEVVRSVTKPMLNFLKQTGSYLTMNLYPFFTYACDEI
jgi:hypothetical protein